MSDEVEEKPFNEQEHQPETDAADQEQEQPTDDADTFPRDYVEKLRAEAAEHRTARKDAEGRAEALTEAYRGLAVANAVADVLADSTDLPWSDEYLTESGLVDADAVRQAAEALVAAKPHLARVRGDAGQGFRHQEQTVSLGALLRANA